MNAVNKEELTEKESLKKFWDKESKEEYIIYNTYPDGTLVLSSDEVRDFQDYKKFVNSKD